MMNWRVSFYSAEFQEEILGLPAGFVARFLRYAERMEVYGPDLGMPHTRARGEVCLSSGSRPWKALRECSTVRWVGRRVIMLHQFIKKSEKTPLNELTVARNRMKEVKDEKQS